MFDIFYTLFRYKDKAQNEELGYYPEKVDVKAFPERRYLWTSRFFVVISCLSLCVSMILASVLCIMIPKKKSYIMPLQIDYKRYQVTRMEYSEYEAYAGNLVTESVLNDYIIKRYTIGDSFEELTHRYSDNEFLKLATSDDVWGEFEQTERPYFEAMQRQGVRRKVEVENSYPVSFNFWQVRFNTIDTIPGKEKPLISKWLASIRMTFNFSRYEDKDLGLKNPYGTNIVTYNLSYLGNNIKSVRK
ncbi:MAG: type IV secretion system protein [Alphaproteobacteria bacterium]|nr:type IV secretion system protein [Alphaproteobacteria bacterium]